MYRPPYCNNAYYDCILDEFEQITGTYDKVIVVGDLSMMIHLMRPYLKILCTTLNPCMILYSLLHLQQGSPCLHPC